MACGKLMRRGRQAALLAAVAAANVLASCERAGRPVGAEGPAATPPAMAQAASAEVDEEVSVFTSPLAGDWYPADAEQLAGQIDEALATAAAERLEGVCAVILPHAGYRWSGSTAAYALTQLKGRTYRRVVVVGPSHRLPMENVASVPDHSHYATPLGKVPLDRAFLARLREHPEFQNIPAAHDGEHSVQIEVPMLQRVLGEFQLVPIVVGQLDLPSMRRMGRILADLVDRRTLVVASSDLTHYGRNFGYVPFRDDVEQQLEQLDKGTIERICRQDLDGLFDYIDRTGTTVCGRCAVGVLLAMLPDDAEIHCLRYDTSGSMIGDFSSSVSYAALVATGDWQQAPPAAAPEESSELGPEDKRRLLRLGRGALEWAVNRGRAPLVDELGVEVTPVMERLGGAFVTLHKEGQLRGCIGEVLPTRPLYRSVMDQAINAALRDHRFRQVEPAELDQIDLEISVLTRPRPVASADEIVLGTHGIILKKGGRSALFLPQVAPEQGWDLETTLAHLARKAGLAGDAWTEGASFEVFEAIVFGEKEMADGPAGQ